MKRYICKPEEFEIYSFDDVNEIMKGSTSYCVFKGIECDCPNGNYYRFHKNVGDRLDKYVLHKSSYLVYGDQGTFKIISEEYLNKNFTELL